MPARIKSMFPRWEEGADFLYLVGGHDGSIKVGHSRDVDRRVRGHRSRMKDNFAWAHVFASPVSGGAESRLLYRFATMAQRVGRTEVFFGVEKRVAIATCREAVVEHANRHATHAAARAHYEREQAAWREFRAKHVFDGTEVVTKVV